MAGSVIVNDGTAQGIKFIDDTGDYISPSVNVVVGINSVIAIQNTPTYKREITVECRSSNARDNLMSALMDSDGIVVNGGQYTVVSVTPVETFGIGDENPIQVWTFRLELVMV